MLPKVYLRKSTQADLNYLPKFLLNYFCNHVYLKLFTNEGEKENRCILNCLYFFTKTQYSCAPEITLYIPQKFRISFERWIIDSMITESFL